MENQRMTPAPDNHLVKAILTMLFCCLPFGIVSLVYATKVEGLWAQGEKELAHKAANDANKWANIGIGCGIAWVVIYSIILFASAYLGLGFGFLFM
jgi:hypothetical protein